MRYQVRASDEAGFNRLQQKLDERGIQVITRSPKRHAVSVHIDESAKHDLEESGFVVIADQRMSEDDRNVKSTH